MTYKFFRRMTVVAIGGALTSALRRRSRTGSPRREPAAHVVAEDVRLRSGIAHHPVPRRTQDVGPEGARCSPAALRIEAVLAGRPVDMSGFEAQFRDALRES